MATAKTKRTSTKTQTKKSTDKTQTTTQEKKDNTKKVATPQPKETEDDVKDVKKPVAAKKEETTLTKEAPKEVVEKETEQEVKTKKETKTAKATSKKEFWLDPKFNWNDTNKWEHVKEAREYFLMHIA